MKRTELKRIAAMLLLSLTLMSVAACGKTDDTSAADITTEDTAVEAPVEETADEAAEETDAAEEEVVEPETEEAAETEEADEETAATEVKAITVEVVDADGNTASYAAETSAEVLYDALIELADDGLTLDGYEGDYGYYITAVNGITADYDADGAYWSLYVNGEYGSYGIDSQPVADGDSYTLAYEVYVAE